MCRSDDGALESSIKPGDLRRFKMTKAIYDHNLGQIAGKSLLIISISEDGWADILVNGVLAAGWFTGFLLDHTEPINGAE